jgi:hypothetical protein
VTGGDPGAAGSSPQAGGRDDPTLGGRPEAAAVDPAVADLRRNYARAALDEGDVDADPVVQFRRWFQDARDARVLEPNAVILATAGADGAPDARTVLLKGATRAASRSTPTTAAPRPASSTPTRARRSCSGGRSWSGRCA